MAERIRSVTVTIVVDTNKQTRERSLTWDEDETAEQFEQRIADELASALEIE